MRFLTPVEDYVITSDFDEPRNYKIIAPKRKQLHEGLDYAPYSQSSSQIVVHAARTGKIVQNKWDGKGYGWYVVIEHDTRFRTWYCHLEKQSSLKIGEHVETDDFVGFMGSTGNSSGRHLHFNVQDLLLGLDNYVVPKVVDPLPLMVDRIDTVQVPKIVYNEVIDRLNRK